MANFHQKSVNVVLLWFVFVSVGITPLFGGMRKFYSFYLSKLGCHHLKAKLEARAGISLFFVGFYLGYFIVSFFSFFSYFFPTLEKGFLIFGDKFSITKKTQVYPEKTPYIKSLIFYVFVETALVVATIFSFLFIFFSTVCSVSSFSELFFIFGIKEAVLSFF